MSNSRIPMPDTTAHLPTTPRLEVTLAMTEIVGRLACGVPEVVTILREGTRLTCELRMVDGALDQLHSWADALGVGMADRWTKGCPAAGYEVMRTKPAHLSDNITVSVWCRVPTGETS